MARKKTDSKTLSVVDLSKVRQQKEEELSKIPDDFLDEVKNLLSKSKKNKLSKAVIWFEVETDDEEKPLQPKLLLWHKEDNFPELHLITESVKNFIFDLCIGISYNDDD